MFALARDMRAAGRAVASTRSLMAAAAAAAALIVLPAAAASAAGSPFPRAVQVKPPSDASIGSFNSQLYSTACTGNGNCVAGGTYHDSAGRTEAYVATESPSRWLRGVKLLLPPGAAAQPDAQVDGLACISAGNCVAIGGFRHDAANDYGLIVTEVNGKWGRGFVPRPPANANGMATYLQAVTCTPRGYCAAVGGYQDKAGHFQTMALVKPVGQRWQRAVEITAPKDAAADPDTNPNGIACTAIGKCVTIGYYSIPGTGTHIQAMGAVLSAGTWHRAVRVSLPANALPAGSADLGSVSCRSGTCTAVGSYYVGANAEQAMWVTESNGHFRAGKEIITVPADAAPVANTVLDGISCPPSGPCVAAGYYTNTAGHQVAMYMTLASGKWTASTLNPPLNAGTTSSQQSAATSVSCTATEHCTIAGWYTDTVGLFRSEAASR
jgi:hypothetical protein